MKRYFITGTDTDVGKTIISAALLLRAQQLGYSTFGLKPLAAGCDIVDAIPAWQNSDAQLLRHYSTLRADYNRHNPIALSAAIAPHLAAQQQHLNLSVTMLLQACTASLAAACDIQLIEGAGGWKVPLNHHETLADFAAQLHADIILVVGLRLGCLNHAILTTEAIHHSGARLVGWIANSVSATAMAAQQDNLHYLNNWFTTRQIPCLGQIPYLADLNPYDCDSLKHIAQILQLPGESYP